MINEGYVKYNARHTFAPATEVKDWTLLNDARRRLYRLGLVGVTKDGIGFGNVSIRYRANEFLVSGTATGALAQLSANDYCLVSSFDIKQNCVVTTGPVQASSEAMTHGAVYQSCSLARCVMHIHSRLIFDGMLRDKYPSTPKSAEYGTPEIALAIGECIAALVPVTEVAAKASVAIVLAGHDEGVVAFGSAVESAFNIIQNLYNKYDGRLTGG